MNRSNVCKRISTCVECKRGSLTKGCDQCSLTVKVVNKVEGSQCIFRDQDNNTVSVTFKDTGNDYTIPDTVLIQRSYGKVQLSRYCVISFLTSVFIRC